MPTTAQIQFDFDRTDRRTKHITPALIAAVTDRIIRHLEPRKVILFGSQASGKAMRGSDIDLLIVLDDSHAFASLKHRNRFGKLLELFRYRSFGLDAFVLTNAEVQEIQRTNEGEWDLVLEILKEGKTLYDSAEKTKTE